MPDVSRIISHPLQGAEGSIRIRVKSKVQEGTTKRTSWLFRLFPKALLKRLLFLHRRKFRIKYAGVFGPRIVLCEDTIALCIEN